MLPDFSSPEQGAATAVWAATSPELDGRGGDYLEDCAIAEVVPDGPQTTYGVRAYALDPRRGRPAVGLVGRGHRGRRLRLRPVSGWPDTGCRAGRIVREPPRFLALMP